MASQAEWSKRVSEWRRSGLSTAEFCRGRDFAASTLRWYSSRLRPRGEPEPKTAMIAVVRDAVRSRDSVLVELEGALVHVPTGADLATLATVFEALRGPGAEGVDA